MILDGISSDEYSPMVEADPWDLDQLLSGEQVMTIFNKKTTKIA